MKAVLTVLRKDGDKTTEESLMFDTDIQGKIDNNNVLNVLRYYCITRDDAERMMENH